MTTYETRFRVRYAETDQMGVVYYSNYFVWMELGRAEYCRASGLRYKDLETNEGILLAVIDAHCRYLSPARYDEEVAVITSIATANKRMVEFEYDIRDALTDRRIAAGETKHLFLSRDMKPVKLPFRYFDAFGIK